MRLEAGVIFCYGYVKILSDNSESKLLEWFEAHPQDKSLIIIITNKDNPDIQTLKIYNNGSLDLVNPLTYSTQDKELINFVRSTAKRQIFKVRCQRCSLNPEDTSEVYKLFNKKEQINLNNKDTTRFNELKTKGKISEV